MHGGVKKTLGGDHTTEIMAFLQSLASAKHCWPLGKAAQAEGPAPSLTCSPEGRQGPQDCPEEGLQTEAE